MLTITACSGSFEAIEVLSDSDLYLKIDQNSQENLDLGSRLPLRTPSEEQEDKAPKESLFLQSLCSLQAHPAVLRHFISGLSPNPMSIVYQVANVARAKNCEALKILERDASLGLALYKIDNLYIGAEALYDENLKIISLQMVNFGKEVELTRQEVPNKEGQVLTTYILRSKNPEKQQGLFFHRSPYMSYGGLLYSSLLALKKDMTYIGQANQGSHTSEGEFKWLDPLSNKADTYTTIEWLKKNNYMKADEGVLLFGVSYDGFNALAGAVSKHPNIKSVVSCSSPANAATDSLSSGKHIEAGLFPYVTNRVSPLRKEGYTQMVNIINSKAIYATKDIQKELDSLLTKKDSPEWNLIVEAGSNKKHPYWAERSLYKDLEDLKTPTLHVGGLKRDQDGRDTILAYEYLQNNNFNTSKNHFLFLHKGGHGCGDAFKSSTFTKFIRLAKNEDVDLSNEPQVTKFSLKERAYKKSDFFQENYKSIPLKENSFVKDLLFAANDDVEVTKLIKDIEVFKAENTVYFNGSPEVNFLYISDLDEVSVHLQLDLIKKNGVLLERVVRSKFIAKKGINSARLKMPPMLATLHKGDKIKLTIQSPPIYSFYRFPQARSYLLTKNENDNRDLGVHILSGGNSALNLPLD